MMVVVPPAAAARLPLSKSSQNTEPSAVSWSKWTWASMPPGTAIRPLASISLRPLSSRSPSATTRPPVMPMSPFTTSDGGGDGGVADDEIVVGHGSFRASLGAHLQVLCRHSLPRPGLRARSTLLSTKKGAVMKSLDRTAGRAGRLGALLAPAMAQTAIKPAIVYSTGGKFDKSFNEGVSHGAEKFKKETGIAVAEFEPTNETQFEQALRRFAQRGQDPIIAVGFSQAVALQKVAKEFPNIHFTIIDSVVDLPNVQSVVFKEHEGSFLVGVLAAMASKTGKIGFVGGMDIPLIRRFQCGFEQGIKYANPKAELIANMTGTTPAAWNDPGRGAELAKGQFDRGVDVVYAAAGSTGIGVLQAAKDRGKLGIGVDSNQNHLHPGSMLTSMLKRVDLAAYNSFKAAQANTWKGGTQVLGLKEGGVDWALDKDNEKLITPRDEGQGRCGQGRHRCPARSWCHDYMSNNSCK